MSRKNNRSKYQRMISFYKKDEATRNERQKARDERREESREVFKATGKLPVPPVLAESSKRAMRKKDFRKVSKMMGSMKIGDKRKRNLNDSSDDSDSEDQDM